MKDSVDDRPGNMDGRKIPKDVFSGGINWDSREPFPPEDGPRAARPGTGDTRRRRPRDISPSNSSDSGHSSLPGHRSLGSNSTGSRTGQSSVPDVPRDPRAPPKSQSWGSQEPPNTASIYFLDNSPHARKNVVSEFGRCVLPPLSVEVNAFVIHNTAKMTVSHFFYNDWAEPIDKASYAFPVPNGCTLASFSYRIGDDKTVSAVVQPVAQARERFARAVREKRTAILLEQDQDSSDIITAHLGNIPGETEIRTEFELVLLLERRIDLDEDTWESVTTLTIPATMASRYGGSVVESKQGPSRMPEGVSIKVEVVQSPELQDLALRSSSHNIDPQMRPRNQKDESPLDLQSGTPATKDDGHSILEIVLEEKGHFLDKDFVLEIRSMPEAEGPKAQAWLGQHTDPDLPKQQALMIHVPPLALSSAHWQKDGESKGEIVFLIDQSNSMDDKIGPLMQATRFLLLNIPRGWKFNICLFGSTYKALWPSSRETNDTNLDESLEWLKERCQGNMGGTEVINALKTVLKNVSCPTQVLLLTDGQVWRLEQTLELIETTRRKSRHLIRFFCLGLGDMTSRALVEGIANSGGGYSDVVHFKDPRWQEKLVNMLASLLVVHINPIRVLLNGKVKPDTALQSPSILSSLNVLQEESIFLLIDSHHTQNIKSVTVFFASEEGEEIDIDIPVQVLDKLEKNDTTIHKLAARALLDDLKCKRSKIRIEPDGPDRVQRIDEWAEEIACGWKLLSKWTNFIMPDQKDGDRPLVPFTSGSAVTQARLLNGILEVDSRLIEAPDRSSEESTTSSSDGLMAIPINRINSAETFREQERRYRVPRREELARMISDQDVRERQEQARVRSEENRHRINEVAARRYLGEDQRNAVERGMIAQEQNRIDEAAARQLERTEMDLREREAMEDSRRDAEVIRQLRLQRERQKIEEKNQRAEQELARRLGEVRFREEESRRREEESRRREEESRRLEHGFDGLDADARVRSTEQRARRQAEEQRRRERDILAEHDIRIEAERAEKWRLREQETRREFQRRFEELARMITELTERFKRKDAEDREGARKDADERARWAEESLRRAKEEELARRETEKRAAERDKLEEERRARDAELHAKKEAETRRALQHNFERLAKMIAELEERIKTKEAEDRENVKKEAEERARRAEDTLTRTEWEREKKRLEREIREAAEADAERRLRETIAQIGQQLGHVRPVQGHLQEEVTPQTGRGANRGRAGIRRAGQERIWRLGVLIQDRMGQWELNGAIARIGQLVSGDETQASGTLLVLALLAVVSMVVLAMTFVFFFMSIFMFLSSWIIALCILRI